MRLHAGVIAYAVGTPFMMLSYHTKCRAFAQEVGIPQDCLVDASDSVAETVATCLVEYLRGVRPWTAATDLTTAKSLARRGITLLGEAIRSRSRGAE
jgi:polysaccharide pyruvyl transferase WcaK-like protein